MREVVLPFMAVYYGQTLLISKKNGKP